MVSRNTWGMQRTWIKLHFETMLQLYWPKRTNECSSSNNEKTSVALWEKKQEEALRLAGNLPCLIKVITINCFQSDEETEKETPKLKYLSQWYKIPS